MADFVTLSDVIVPEVFNPYMQQRTEEKTRLIQAGVLTRDNALDALLAGAGLTFNTPSFKDLASDEENISSDDDTDSTPKKIQTSQEVSCRLSRNQSWASADLVTALAGKDPMMAIADLVAGYWARRLQQAFVATMQGTFADNDAAPTGADQHLQGDRTVSIIGGGYTAGVTDFSAEAALDAAVTMGDSETDLSAIMVHSIVYNRMQKNNLIDFIPDSQGVVNIPTFLGRMVIVDDSMPNPAQTGAAQTASGIYHTWLLGTSVVRLGVGSAKVPTEVLRQPGANKGGGLETMWSRQEWMLHPQGHAFIGDLSSAPGGPSNATSSNNLAHADSWRQVFPERKQIKIARLITRES